MDWIIENKDWIFSGIGVLIIGIIINYFIDRNKQNDKLGILDNSSESSVEVKNEVVINNILEGKNSGNLAPKSALSSKDELETRKKLTNILFVDDDTKFKIIKILNVSGWINTKIIKDIDNPDSDLVKNSHILFVDINGVGIKMGFKDEGLGLANYLKKKYPEKKVIIYSTEQGGNRFHEALRKVDDFLHKNAEPSEFQEIIEQFSAEVDLK
ncbi:response regulator [Flavobacterium channae]|uniref:response regulator n=1 Tax=Flavobacterium channae TaxID=2897181 RepID=UPI001E493C9D|nr:response regulator [Flavobacterium channae]UGS23790.1 response regulator [Flavobacterium channae]